MISYTLACDRGHRFEAWFRNGADFDAQAVAGAVSCPQCGSTGVAKSLMAPAVVTSRRRAAMPVAEIPPPMTVEAPAAPAPNQPAPASPAPETADARGGAEPAPSVAAPAAPAPEQASLAAPDPRQEQLIALLREVRQRVRETSEYVGERFPEEARRIHYGEAERRGIYGEASLDEVQKLAEEGVEVHPLPALPEEHN